MINEDFLNLVKTQLHEYENAPSKIMSNHCVVLSFVDMYILGEISKLL